MDKNSKVLIDIKFYGKEMVEIIVENIGDINTIIKKKLKKRQSFFLKVNKNFMYDSKKIEVKRLLMIEDDLLENIKSLFFKPLRNIKIENIYFNRMLLDNHNYPIYKKALLELGLNLSKIHNICQDGMLYSEVNGFRNFVEYNAKRGK